VEWPYGNIGGCPYLLLFKQLNLSLRTHTKVKTHTSMSLRLRYTAKLPGPWKEKKSLAPSVVAGLVGAVVGVAND
jgi:hypothetical protein